MLDNFEQCKFALTFRTWGFEFALTFRTWGFELILPLWDCKDGCLLREVLSTRVLWSRTEDSRRPRREREVGPLEDRILKLGHLEDSFLKGCSIPYFFETWWVITSTFYVSNINYKYWLNKIHKLKYQRSTPDCNIYWDK